MPKRQSAVRHIGQGVQRLVLTLALVSALLVPWDSDPLRAGGKFGEVCGDFGRSRPSEVYLIGESPASLMV